MMAKSMTITWNLRRIMAEQGMFRTSDLVPLLEAHGVSLSREQVFRLVTQNPQRLNVDVLAALCGALSCTPSDLLEVRVTEERAVTQIEQTRGNIGSLRPPRAQIHPPRGDTAR